MISNQIKSIDNILSDDDIQSIFSLNLNLINEKRQAINQLNSGKKERFDLEIPSDCLQKISEAFGLNIENPVPVQFIKGNSVPHIDKNGDQQFLNTYLLYLTDTNNKLVVGNESHSIRKGKGFVFSNNTIHGTTGDENDIRLSIGPFNEFKSPVGLLTIYSFHAYFSDGGGHYEPVDSITPNIEPITIFDYSYMVSTYAANIPAGTMFAGWDIVNPPETIVYTGNQVIQPEDFGYGFIALYPLFTSNVCFGEDTKILTFNQLTEKEEYVPIQNIKVGTMVKTLKNGYVPVNTIGSGNMLNYDNDSRIGKRMYKCSTEKYPELFEDLYISGYHSILIDKLTDEQKNKCIKVQKQVLFTEDMCRLPACADERTEPCRQSGLMKIWNIALNNKDKKGNYGIYANGLLVESCSIDRLKNKSGLRIK